MVKDSFVIYNSFYKPISKLSDKQLGRLFRAIFEYNLGEVVNVEEDIEMAFGFFVNQFEIDEAKYQSKIKRDVENGRKGGNPNFKRGQRNPYYEKKDNRGLCEITEDNRGLSHITQDKAINDNVNVNDNDSEDKSSSSPLTPQGGDVEEEELKKKIEEYKQKPIWKQDIQKKFHLEPEEIDRLLDEFYLDMRCREYDVRNVSSFFTGWLLQKQKSDEGKRNNNPGGWSGRNGKQFRGSNDFGYGLRERVKT